ncbi:hypothetical protein OK016_13205 [Vibrio chagasii]|nr:hypothetical protein [Vibrio chagasii]
MVSQLGKMMKAIKLARASANEVLTLGDRDLWLPTKLVTTHLTPRQQFY